MDESRRQRRGRNPIKLPDPVEAAADWRDRFRERPYLFLGAAFVGGMVMAGALGSGRSGSAATASRPAGGNRAVKEQARELWHNIQGALVSLAAVRIKEYISQRVPEFDQHYRRAEQKAAVDPTTTSIGGTTG